MAWSANAFGQEATGSNSDRPLDTHYHAEIQVAKPPISTCEYRNRHQDPNKELQDRLTHSSDNVTTTPVITVTGKCPEYLDLHAFQNPIEYQPTVFDKYWKDKKKPKPAGMGGIPFDLTDMLVTKRPSLATPSPFDGVQMDKQAKAWNQANPGLPQEVQDMNSAQDKKQQ